MDFVYFGIILVIIIGIILFMPKGKKHGNKDAKKAKLASKAKVKSSVQKPPRAAKIKEPANSRKRPGKVAASTTHAKPGKSEKQMKAHPRKTNNPDLSAGSDFSLEDELLNDDSALLQGIVDAPATEMKEIVEDESSQHDEINVANDFFVDVNNKEMQHDEDFGTYSASGEVNSMPTELHTVPEPEPVTDDTAQMKITLGNEPAVTGRHVRKKLVQESTVSTGIQMEQDAFEFVGSDLAGFESPTVDDIFSESEFDNGDYSEMLFSEVENDINSDSSAKEDNSSVAKMMESVRQVSPELEPIDDSPQADEPEKIVEEKVPEEDARPNEAMSDNAVQKDIESVGKTAADQFNPGSVSFTRNSRLKFRKRSNAGKSSDLLPDKFTASCSDGDVILQCQSANVKQPVQNNGMLELYNSHVYRDGKTVPWDVRFELQLCEGDEATVDTGIGIRVPEGYGIELVPVSDLETKYGLALVSPTDVSRLDAMFSLKFVVRSIRATSYVQKNKALVCIRIYRI